MIKLSLSAHPTHKSQQMMFNHPPTLPQTKIGRSFWKNKPSSPQTKKQPGYYFSKIAEKNNFIFWYCFPTKSQAHPCCLNKPFFPRNKKTRQFKMIFFKNKTKQTQTTLRESGGRPTSITRYHKISQDITSITWSTGKLHAGNLT